ncbi:MAG: Ig-like domain-containing protein [Rhodoferax sp.]|nr:Ig-like domain-containing protein [Rhodoferax sp.]
MKFISNRPDYKPWALAGVVLATLAGCGGGDGREPILGGSGGLAQPAPIVTAVTPAASATNVPFNTKLFTAAFSKAMDPTTLSASNFTLACPVGSAITGGVVTYATTGNIATLTLPAATMLPTGAVCTATVANSVKDTYGIALVSNYSWSFTVSSDVAAPMVSTTNPANNATNVARNTSVGVTFTEPMEPSTITATNVSVKETVSGNAVAGTLSYSGVTAVFMPTTPLTAGTRYTLTVKGGAGGVSDLAGNRLANDFTTTWTTGGVSDSTAPVVASTINANGATNVPVNTKVGATFSEGMDPLTITATNFQLKVNATGAAVPGTLSYSGRDAVFTPTNVLAIQTVYTATVKGGTGGVKDLAGNLMASDYVWSWTTVSSVDVAPPTVSTVSPANGATNVPLNSAVNATFSEPMDPLTINSASFMVAGVSGTVNYNAQTQVATFTPSANLAANTTYTATVNTQAKDIAGNAMTANRVWSFTTAATPPVVPVSVALGAAGAYGTFGGTAGMTNTGTLTIINGDIGTIATATGSITGFHDTAGDIYTETPANKGAVNGKIYTCTNSTTGPTSAGPNAPACAIATQARLDAQTAYLALAAMPPLGGSPAPGANMAGVTLLPGVYTAPGGSYLIQGGNLTLDAQGDANAVWVFQMAGTLTVGGPGAAFPQSIILAGGAQAKNVYWQVGSFATINAGGGGTMVGTIISQAGASFSTAGNVTLVTLQGRALSLGASVTLVNTVIQVPAP